MDDDGKLLPRGEIGEIVIRGPNVTSGYVDNPQANAKSFTNGWFRTGDQGTLDEDGYLRITGRLKEMINRGGEKVSPLEVDVVLMEHPAVAQVADLRHAARRRWAKRSAAAVVLREGKTASERELRDFAAKHLADFKVPRKVVFLTEIPEGRHRQAAAHRPGREAGPGRHEGLHLRRRRHRRVRWRRSSPRRAVEVSCIARGPHLAAMQANGLTLRQRRRDAGGPSRAASTTPREAGPAGLRRSSPSRRTRPWPAPRRRCSR